MSHPSIDLTGRASEKVNPYRIGFSTAMCRQFAVARERGDRGAFFLEFLNSAGPTPDQIAFASGQWGDALRQHVREEFGRWLGVRIYSEQLPDEANSVSLDPRVRDYFGSPVPHVRWSLGRYEQKTLDDARATVGKIFTAIGLTNIRTGGITLSGHQIGTHRMGIDPRKSVVDGNLRTHDLPNLYLVGSGCFVTASASPPTLTIAALAIRAAEHIAAELRGTG